MKRLKKESSNEKFLELADKLDEVAKLIWEANKIWGKMNDENHDEVASIFEEKLAHNLGLFADSLEETSKELRKK